MTRMAVRISLAAAALALLSAVWATPGGAQTGSDPGPDATALELAERYAPVIVLKSQDAPCDADGEPYGPTSVEIVLNNPEVLLRQVGDQNPVVQRGPSARDLFGLGEGFFLDFPGGALEPGCIFERDFNRYSAEVPVTVYAHVVQQEDHPDQLALQYWFYWYYNDWNNKHESDWEGIQLLFDASSAEDALTIEPTSVGYAQHEGGERAAWDSNKLERDGTHPVVYPSAGSHASYFGSAVYMGRSASEGFGCDSTDGPSERFQSEVVLLPDAVGDPDDPLAWLAYEGRWGERQRGAFNGPTGPVAKGRWLEPIDWHDELRSSSVVIPAGDSFGEQVIGAFCSTVEWGSSKLIAATTSPLRLLVTALVALAFARWLIGRTDWSRVALAPLVMRRRAGQIIRAGYRRYRRSWRDMLRFGTVFVPATLLAALLSFVIKLIPLIGDTLDLAGDDSGTNFVLALTAGGLPQLAATFAVSATVSVYLGEERSAHDAVRMAWARRGELLATFGRAFLIIAALFISIIGIPWAIRQIVRYQFTSQVVMLEGRRGRDALQRSSQLIEGRWWHTALMVSIFGALPFVSSVTLGLLLLLALSGLPLWFFSAVMTLVYALLVPLASTAQTMLYGDALAELNGATDADPEPALASAAQ